MISVSDTILTSGKDDGNIQVPNYSDISVVSSLYWNRVRFMFVGQGTKFIHLPDICLVMHQHMRQMLVWAVSDDVVLTSGKDFGNNKSDINLTSVVCPLYIKISLDSCWLRKHSSWHCHQSNCDVPTSEADTGINIRRWQNCTDIWKECCQHQVWDYFEISVVSS